MLQDFLLLSRTRLPDLRLSGTRFGPYLNMESVPWLLLATVFRARARSSQDDVSAVIYAGAGEFALFLAFLIASQRMIQLWGGATSLERLKFKEEVRLAWSAIWRLNLLCLVLAASAIAMGVANLNAVGFFLGFDGIVIKRPHPWLPLWSAMVAALLYLMVVERGMDRKPKGHRVLMLLIRQIRYLLPALIILSGFYWIMGEIQRILANWIEPIYQYFNASISGIMLVGFTFVFSYARLLITVYLLTIAVRRFYVSGANIQGSRRNIGP